MTVLDAQMEKFYKIRDAWTLEYHGIRMNRVMIFEMYDLAQGYDIGIPNHWLRMACHTYDLSTLKFDSPNSILSTFGKQNRKDHKEVYDFVTQSLGDKVSYNDLNKLRITKKLRPFLMLRVITQSMWSLRKCAELSRKKKLRLSLLACVYCNALRDLEKLPLKGVKKYLSMYHVDQLENMITQYMKLKNIPTYSLCEGVYLVDKKHLTIDSVQYTNFETDHLFVWGQFVIDQFVKEGIPADRMIVGGYPHVVQLKPMRKNNSLNSCFVMLARNDYMEADMRLLQILSKHTDMYRFYLKPHPHSDINAIEQYALSHNMEMVPKTMTINECMTNATFDWAIAVNTTAYYEALMRGIPCLRYDDGSYVLFPGTEDDFHNANQLEQRIQEIASNLKSGKYQQEVDDMLKYVMGVGINNYSATLLSV